MIGKRLRELRIENDLLQKDLAEKIGITQQSISFYESGRREPDNELLIKFANFFDVSIDYLLGRTDIRDIEEVHTIAAHHDGDEFTEEELQEIENFKKYVLSKRKK